MKRDFSGVIQKIVFLILLFWVILDIIYMITLVSEGKSYFSLIWNGWLSWLTGTDKLAFGEVPLWGYIMATPIEVVSSPVVCFVLLIVSALVFYLRKLVSIFLIEFTTFLILSYSFARGFGGVVYLVMIFLGLCFGYLVWKKFFRPTFPDKFKKIWFTPTISFLVIIVLAGYVFLATVAIGFFDFLMLSYSVPKINKLDSIKQSEQTYVLAVYDKKTGKYFIQDPKGEQGLFSSFKVEVKPVESSAPQQSVEN